MKARELAEMLLLSPDDDLNFVVCLGDGLDQTKAKMNRLGGFAKIPPHDNVVFVMVHLNETVDETEPHMEKIKP